MQFENFEDKLRKKLEQAEVSPKVDLWQKIDAQLHGTSFEKTLRKKLENSSVTPSEKVWENIYRTLHGARSQKFVFYYWQHAAAVAAILLVLAWAFYPATPKENTEITLETTISIPNPQPEAAPTTNSQAEDDARTSQKNTVKNSLSPAKIQRTQLKIAASIPQKIKENIHIEEHTTIAQSPENKATTQLITQGNSELQPKRLQPEKQIITPVTQPDNIANVVVMQLQTLTAQTLNEKVAVVPVSFAETLTQAQNNATEAGDWWAKVELPHTEKKSKWRTSFALGTSKISYNSYQSYPIESWNRLGIGSVTVLDDSMGNQALNYPRQLGEFIGNGSQNADIELLVSKNTQYMGMGVGYELAKWLEVESGLRVQYQKLRTFTLPLEAVENANKAGVFNPYEDWVRNYDQDYITRSTDPLTATTVMQKVEVQAKNNWVAEIPLMLKFKLPIKRSTFSVSTGASYRQLLNQLGELRFSNKAPNSMPSVADAEKSTRINKVYRNQNGTVNLRVEYAYRINPKNSVFLAGTSQWFMQSMFGEETTLRYPRLLGLETGMQF